MTPPVGAGPLYHYHKASFCLMENGTASGSHSAMVGWMNDGFAMYGFHDIGGAAPVLDECNGHFGCIDDSCNTVTYHYHSNNFQTPELSYQEPNNFLLLSQNFYFQQNCL